MSMLAFCLGPMLLNCNHYAMITGVRNEPIRQYASPWVIEQVLNAQVFCHLYLSASFKAIPLTPPAVFYSRKWFHLPLPVCCVRYCIPGTGVVFAPSVPDPGAGLVPLLVEPPYPRPVRGLIMPIRGLLGTLTCRVSRLPFFNTRSSSRVLSSSISLSLSKALSSAIWARCCFVDASA